MSSMTYLRPGQELYSGSLVNTAQPWPLSHETSLNSNTHCHFKSNTQSRARIKENASHSLQCMAIVAPEWSCGLPLSYSRDAVIFHLFGRTVLHRPLKGRLTTLLLAIYLYLYPGMYLGGFTPLDFGMRKHFRSFINHKRKTWNTKKRPTSQEIWVCRWAPCFTFSHIKEQLNFHKWIIQYLSSSYWISWKKRLVGIFLFQKLNDW